MDAKTRIRQLMDERNWSEYRLAIASSLSQSTVANIFNRNTTPSVSTLESICAGFGITLAQFFAEGDMVELTQEQREMFAAWSSLTKDQKDVLRQLTCEKPASRADAGFSFSGNRLSSACWSRAGRRRDSRPPRCSPTIPASASRRAGGRGWWSRPHCTWWT